jgi:hypothetical protein
MLHAVLFDGLRPRRGVVHLCVVHAGWIGVCALGFTVSAAALAFWVVTLPLTLARITPP